MHSARPMGVRRLGFVELHLPLIENDEARFCRPGALGTNRVELRNNPAGAARPLNL